MLAQGRFVGELQEKWEFPSDHLPIGIRIQGTEIGIVSWNILNSAFLSFIIEKDTQGLQRSTISRENIPYNNLITVREDSILKIIENMLSRGISIIGLQECGANFLKELRIRLEPHQYYIYGNDIGIKDQTVLIFNKNRFGLISASTETGLFSDNSNRGIQNIVLSYRNSQFRLRIFNTHLPGRPGNPAPDEFVEYLSRYSNDSIMAMGDMNINEVEMDLTLAHHRLRLSVIAPYPSNISPSTLRSKAIDLFLVPDRLLDRVKILEPDEVLPGLSEDLKLLL